MASPIVWKNVSVAMQSALGTVKTITNITKANPGVVTATAHGLENGDIVYLEVQGMHQLNEKAYVSQTRPQTHSNLRALTPRLSKPFRLAPRRKSRSARQLPPQPPSRHPAATSTSSTPRPFTPTRKARSPDCPLQPSSRWTTFGTPLTRVCWR